MKSISTLVHSLIEETKSAGRYSTAGVYRSAFNSFSNFTGNEPLTFKKLTPQLLKRYEEHLLLQELCNNTVSTYMRMLHSLFTQACLQSKYPVESIDKLFRHVFTGYMPTAKRAVSPTLIRRLTQLDLKDHPDLCFSRDLFLLSFYLRGMPFVDLVHLRKTDVQNGTIYYYRHKTRHQLSVYIEPCAAAILQKYAPKDPSSPYLLPILSAAGEKGYRQYRSGLRLYNIHLGRLSKMLHLDEPLTSYVARHSWATTAKEKGISISVISEGLGHASEKVTHVYLASFKNTTMRQANKMVISTVNPPTGKKKK